MTPQEFRAALAELGVNQAEFRRLLARQAGQAIGNVTVWRWASGERAIPAGVVAWIKCLRREKRRKRTTDWPRSESY